MPSESYTKEVIYFFEQVTGHLIPDFRFALRHGLKALIDEMSGKEGNGYKAFVIALEAACLLAERYEKLARKRRRRFPSLKNHSLILWRTLLPRFRMTERRIS